MTMHLMLRVLFILPVLAKPFLFRSYEQGFNSFREDLISYMESVGYR
jgi:hypothetical protein